MATVTKIRRPNWLVWLRKRLGLATHRSCLNCAFLGHARATVSQEDRDLFALILSTSVNSVTPHWQDVWCSKRMWTNYILTYSAPTWPGLSEELKSDRKTCLGWMRFRPGYSPQEHRDFQKAHWAVWDTGRSALVAAFLGALAAALFAWLIPHR